MGLFRRQPRVASGGAALDTAGDLVEVAVLERWRSEAAVEALRRQGIRAAALDAHGRRGSWAGECSAELFTHEQRMTVVATARIVVHHADAARARRVLCELTED